MSISVTFKNRFKECVQEYCAGHGDCGSVRLAEKMGISYSVYSRILQYGILPKPDVLVRIADFFDVSADYLIGRTDDERFAASGGNATFAERLELIRAAKGVTYYRIAERTGINRNYFTEWKSGRVKPSLPYLVAVANYFGASLDYLLGRTDDDTPPETNADFDLGDE